MNSNWETNELYCTIHNYIDDKQQADDIFNCILPYMLETFGEANITVSNLCFIMPGKLYKNSISNTISYYKDLVYIIMRYKTENQLDLGFPLKKYEELFNTNIKYENALSQKRLVKEQHRVKAIEKKLKSQKCKQQVIKNEDFDKNLVITKENIIRYVQQQYGNIEFLDEQYFEKSNQVKNLFNYRNGSLVYNNPFRNKTIKDLSIYWIGMCDCGNYRITQAGRITDYDHCPICEKPEHIYIGERQGHLEVIDQRYILNGKHSLTLQLKCKCDCGSIIILTPGMFKGGTKTNCGKQCRYAIEQRNQLGQANAKHITRVFHKDTNVTKIGRTESNSNSSTGYLGVTFIPATNTYMAYITFQGKTEILGSSYKTPEQAYAVRLSAQNIIHKEFVDELEKDKFIQQNKYLRKLLAKVKKSVEKVDEIIGGK